MEIRESQTFKCKCGSMAFRCFGGWAIVPGAIGTQPVFGWNTWHWDDNERCPHSK